MNVLFCFFILLMNAVAYALPFNITVKSGTSLPATVPAGGTATAYYTVANNTHLNIIRNFVKYLPPNVAQVTEGNTFPDICGASFDLAPQGQVGDSCTLQLAILGPVNGQDPNPYNHLFVCFFDQITCAGTLFPLNVSIGPPALTSLTLSPSHANIDVGTTQQFTALGTYTNGSIVNLTSAVTWQTENAIATPSATGLVTGNATGFSNITATFENLVSRIATLNVKSFVYISNSGSNNLAFCSINADRSLNCDVTPAKFVLPFGLGMHPLKTSLYVVNNMTDNISYCPLNSDGSLGLCQLTASGILGIPYDIAINPQGTFAYMTYRESNSVYFCPIHANGSLGPCQTTGSGFSEPSGITINHAGTFAYIANHNTNTISYCSITHDGSLGPCTTTNASFTFPTGVALNPTGTAIYATNNGDVTVSICPVNLDGSLATCRIAGNHFKSPSDIILTADGMTAYIVNQRDSTVSFCAVRDDGMFNHCQTTGAITFTNPIRISIS